MESTKLTHLTVGDWVELQALYERNILAVGQVELVGVNTVQVVTTGGIKVTVSQDNRVKKLQPHEVLMHKVIHNV